MAMSKNDVNIVESLIRGGASSAEIMSEIEKIEARIKVEEEAKKKAVKTEKEKIAKRDAARTKLIEAVIQYALDFGWVEKKDVLDKDIKALDEVLRAEEKVLDRVNEFGEKLDGCEDVFERLMDSLMGDFAKDAGKKDCKCGQKDGCSKSETSLLDQIDELLRQ